MVQLQELRDTMIKEVSVQLPVGEVTRTLMEELSQRVAESKGEAILRVNLYDPATNASIRLFWKSHKVGLAQSLVNYLEENAIRYTIS